MRSFHPLNLSKSKTNFQFQALTLQLASIHDDDYDSMIMVHSESGNSGFHFSARTSFVKDEITLLKV